MATKTSTAKTTLHTFPPIVLDTTLYHLLLADRKDGEAIETLCELKPNSDPKYGRAIPLSDKYIIHAAQLDDSDDLAHMQLEICSYLLMFFAGPMKVVFVGAEGLSDDKTLSKKVVDENARRSFGVITQEQRPVIKTYANLDDFAANHDRSPIRWGFAMDFAERLPSLFHPSLTYKLNSKRWLGECPLKSANDQLIDCLIPACPNATSSSSTTTTTHWSYCNDTCSPCRTAILHEIQRVRDILIARPLPYVLKLTQSLASVGTNIVRTLDDREAVIDKMTTYLRTYLPRVTRENAGLHTTTLVLSDAIPGETMALNFYVRRTREGDGEGGKAVFLGACHQLATGETGRQSTAITYADQAELEGKYAGVVGRIAEVLSAEGYYGPVGADVMEDPDTGELYTIDLNVRTPLSFILYLLKGHFCEQRGLGMALVYECIILGISRDELEERFSNEFQEGRLVLLGATRLGTKKKWAFGAIVAGRDREEIENLSKKILRFETGDQMDD